MRVQETFSIFGGNDAEVTPVPIPNTEVKLCSADGTWWEAARESRSLPELKRTSILGVLFLLFFCQKRLMCKIKVFNNDAEVTPVPIPNTERR